MRSIDIGFLRVWLLGVALVLGGCGDEGGGPGPDAGPDGASSPDAALDAAQPDGAPDPDAALDPDGGGGPVWVVPTGTTWHIQYSDTPVDQSVDALAYNVDLFDTPQATIDALHGAGRRVICYYSSGSHEDWRPDAGDFPSDSLGNDLDGWPGERWLDVRHPGLRPVMGARLDLAVTKSCDGVDPDNVDGYTNNTGFPLSYAEQLAYNTWTAGEAHARGLAVGLKNDLEQVPDLAPLYDFAVNEECLDYSECGLLHPFVAAGKAVFHLEYVNQPADGAAMQAQVCGQAVIQGFSTLIKTWDLDAWFLDCP